MVCGTSTIDLAIQICPVIYTGFNKSLLILNHILDNVDCQGTLDTSVAPPVVRFSFPIREGNACGSNFMVSLLTESFDGRWTLLNFNWGGRADLENWKGIWVLCFGPSEKEVERVSVCYWLHVTHSNAIAPISFSKERESCSTFLLWFHHCCLAEIYF